MHFEIARPLLEGATFFSKVQLCWNNRSDHSQQSDYLQLPPLPPPEASSTQLFRLLGYDPTSSHLNLLRLGLQSNQTRRRRMSTRRAG